MKLQDFFERIYIINLPERADRRRGMERELKEIGLDFSMAQVRIFPAVRPAEALAFPSIGTLGCYLSHLEILRTARKEGLSNVLIMEDDLAISSRFNTLEKDVLNDLKSQNWDLVFLGYFPYHGFQLSDYYDDSHGQFVSASKLLKETQYPTQGTHFYAVNHTLYDALISFLEELLSKRSEELFFEPDSRFENLDGAYIDTAYYIFRKKNPDILFFVTCPCLGWQRNTLSDVNLSDHSFFDRVSFLQPIANLQRNIKYRVKRILEAFNPDTPWN